MVPDEEGETGIGPEQPNCSVCTRVGRDRELLQRRERPGEQRGRPAHEVVEVVALGRARDDVGEQRQVHPAPRGAE